MGRQQLSITQAQQDQLFLTYRKNPNSPEGRQFQAPTLDADISHARRQRVKTTPHAISTLADGLPLTTVSGPILSPPSPITTESNTEGPPRTPSPVIFAPIIPPSSPPPVWITDPIEPPTMERRPLYDFLARDPLWQGPPPGIPDPESLPFPSTPPIFMGVPVALADSIVSQWSHVPRYAMLGPYDAGAIWAERIIRLTNGSSHTVTIRKNHGSTQRKPWCAVIETDYLIGNSRHSLILLAAHFLIHPSFRPEPDPEPVYLGNQPGFIMFDYMATRALPQNYGIPIYNYRRVSTPELRTIEESAGTEYGEDDEEEQEDGSVS